MIRRTKTRCYYCATCGEPRGKDEVMKGSELVARKLVIRRADRIKPEERQVDPIRCIECHQKVRIQVFPSWKSRYERVRSR